MSLKITTLMALFSLSLASQSHAAGRQDITLNDQQTWQCHSQFVEGYTFASQSVAFVAPDCPRFFADQNGIFEPLKQSAHFEPSNVPQGCFLEGYRYGLGVVASSMHSACESQLGASIRAGLRLGQLACRLSPEGTLSPDLDLVHIRSKAYDPNSETFILDFFMPVRSKIWGQQLSRSQEAGFQVGCFLGERDYFNQIPSGFLLPDASPDWARAAKEVGKEFGRAYCPMEPERIDTILQTLVGPSAEPNTSLALVKSAFIQGFQTRCDKTFSH